MHIRRRSRIPRAALPALTAAAIFSGCYYDKFTKLRDDDGGDGGSSSSGGSSSGDGGSGMGGDVNLGGMIISDVAVATLDEKVMEQGGSLVLDLLGNDGGPGIEFLSTDETDPDRPAALDATEFSVTSRGVLTFVPADEFWGVYEASYTIEDENGEQASADIRIHVIPKNISLATVEAGWGGFVVDGEAGDFLGASVSAAGDVNGDGVADFLVGAPGSFPAPGEVADETTTGRVALIFGRSGIGDLQLDQTDVEDFVQIFNGSDDAGRHRLGASVSPGGRINDDDLDDVILGTSVSGELGAVYVLYGRDSFPAEPITVDDVPEETVGYTITGVVGRTGAAVSGGFDMNADGADDVLAYAADSGVNIRVDFETTSGTASTVADLEFTSFQNTPSVAMVGDLFGSDDKAEVLTATFDHVILIRGADTWPTSASGIDNTDPDIGWKTTTDIATATDFSQVAAIGTFDGNQTRDVAYCMPDKDCRIVPTTESADDYELDAGWDITGFTSSVPRLAGEGDVNDDGFHDVVLAEADNAYLIWGLATLPTNALDIADMDDEGVSIDPNGATLGRVAIVGDVNDDGLDDYALTVPEFDTDKGRVYVIFGTRTELP